jgi:hypothetical protein
LRNPTFKRKGKDVREKSKEKEEEEKHKNR